MSKQPSQNKALQNDVNWENVADYLRSQNLVVSNEPLEVDQFSAGYSNLTYFIRVGEWQAVLRRPPFGPLPPKAHDMKREYVVLKKLNSVFPLAPKPYLFCEDTKVMERHFYVMEKKDGVVIDDSIPKQFEDISQAPQLISNAVMETLTALHSLDYKDAGLENFGYPDGYLSRQVHGWIKRYSNCKTDEFTGVEALEKWLVDHIPASPAPTIVHNDFKLNNMMFAADNPSKVIGLFDWELSTIGDPLTDLAAALAYWAEEGEPYTGLTSVTAKPGFASRREMLELYAKKSGRDVSNIDYYLTFAFYKVAVVLQQLYYRWKIGEAKDVRFQSLIIGIENLLKMAAKAQRKELLK
ncbi:phosphotransferase family protein [Bacillus dakarensis]|uniref:phosphotransferase family protein n=1 Tax=Robertmurraya dakarensis TaxID=1926278 RepID=UPI000980DA92|nr:phosphotransferase family protein [Bacillus dakarensis]